MKPFVIAVGLAIAPAPAAAQDASGNWQVTVTTGQRGTEVSMWGDPALELAQVLLHAVPFVLTGYEEESSDGLGGVPAAGIVWDTLERATEPGATPFTSSPSCGASCGAAFGGGVEYRK